MGVSVISPVSICFLFAAVGACLIALVKGIQVIRADQVPGDADYRARAKRAVVVAAIPLTLAPFLLCLLCVEVIRMIF